MSFGKSVDPNLFEYIIDDSKNENQSKWMKLKKEFKSFCSVLYYLIFKSFKFYSLRVYLVLICLISLFSSMIQGGYISAIIKSLQTEFNLSINTIGIILSCFDIMSVFSLPIVSYIGSKYNKPRIIAILSIIYSIGAILFIFPFFLHSKYVPTSYDQAFKSSLCLHNSSSNNTYKCNDFYDNTDWMYGLFILAQFVMSWGVAPQFSLGISFITDNSEEKYHAIYTGIIYGSVALGPAIGYLLASYFLSLWVYLSDPTPNNISQTDSEWVGAWYLGFVVSAICVFILSLILITFPNKIERTSIAIKNNNNVNQNNYNKSLSCVESNSPSIIDYNLQKNPNLHLETIQEVSEISGTSISNVKPIDSVSNQIDNNESIKKKSLSWCFLIHLFLVKLRILGFLSSFPRLLRNFRFSLLVIIISVEAILVSVFVHYMILYSQNVYQLTESTASILVGAIIVPAAIIGALLGGFIVNKFKLDIIGLTRLILSSSTIVLAGILITMLIRCESTPSIGIDLNEQGFLKNAYICNKTCSQCNYNYNPVCDEQSGFSYVSACYAGCSNSTSTNIFFNCSCTSSGQIVQNKCSNKCNTNFIIFLIILFILVTAESICLTPITILLLKLIDKQLHPFGLGVMRMSSVLIANVPTPLLLSYGFSQTCVLWETDICTGNKNKNGNCLEYNNNSFHFVLFGTLLGVKTFAWLLMIWFTIHIHRSYIFRSRFRNSINLNHDITAPKAVYQKNKHQRQISSVPVSIKDLSVNGSINQSVKKTSQVVLIRHNKTSSY